MTALALDTNLLLLLIVGRTAPTMIEKHKRLSNYGSGDFRLLLEALGKSSSLVGTPNAMTEASNLVGYGVREPLRSRLYLSLVQLAEEIDEVYHPSRLATNDPAFTQLGLTDAAWLGILDDETVILTDDANLFLTAAARGFRCMKLDQLRRPTG